MAYINGRKILFSTNANMNIKLQEGSATANGEYFPDTGYAFSKFTVNVTGGGGEIKTEYRTIRRDSNTVYDFEFDGIRYKKLENAYVPDELTVQSILDLGITYHTKSTMNDGYETNGTIGEDDIEIDVTEFGTSVMIFAASLMIVRFTGTPSEELPQVENNALYMTDFFGSLFEYADFTIPFVVSSSGECTKEHINTVDVLPEIGVDGEHYSVLSIKGIVLVMDGDQYVIDDSIAEILTATPETYNDIMPTNPEYSFVYVPETHEVYMWADGAWYPLSEDGYSFKGEIDNIEHATEDGYYAYMESVLYKYENGRYVGFVRKGDLIYTSNGDGTCSVTGVEANNDRNIVVPSVSPSGDSVKKIDEYAFRLAWVENVKIPDSVTSTGTSFFSGNKTLKSVEVGNGISTIEVYAFYECYSLESVTFGNSVTKLDRSSFERCYSLESITLPASLTVINSAVFDECYSLKNIIFEGTVEQWKAVYLGYQPFAGIPATKVICSDGEVTL